MKSSIFNIFHSYTTLLPGDLGDCLDPKNTTDPTCVGGLAAVSSIIRHSQIRGDGPAIHLPKMDRESKFVQMHPEGWGVNRLIAHDYFGYDTFLAPPSLFADERRLGSIELLIEEFQPVMSNVDLRPTSMWSNFIRPIRQDIASSTATIVMNGENQPLTVPSVQSMNAALDYVAYVNSLQGCFEYDTAMLGDINCLIPTVHYSEKDETLGDELLEAALAHPYPPLVFSETYSDREKPELMNNTIVVTFDDGGDIVSHLYVDVNLEGWSIMNYTFTATDLADLPEDYKDEQYIEDMVYLRSMADSALANDPVVGSSGFMPFTRIDDWRMCMGGECPIGNLFTDAIRWASDSDFAVLPSGGLRGEGWESGEVRVSDVWGALPFLNHVCTGVMSGVSIFRLLNYSTAVATFESTYTDMGDRLLQLSGIKMTYNTELNGSSEGRLISVDVWDKSKDAYVPLERLKLYKFATDNWMCDHFDPYPSMLKVLTIQGEVNGAVDTSRPIQDVVGGYLSHLSDLDMSYDTSLRGSHVNDTDSLEPMQFIQTAASCLNGYFWKEETLTCTRCPGGKYVKFAEEIMSFLITPDSTVVAGRNVLSNRELYNVTIAAKQIPAWVMLKNSDVGLVDGSTILQPGDSVAIEFGIDASGLNEGNTRSTVSFGVILDGNYPGCLTDLDITFDTAVEVRGEENLNHLGYIRAVGFTLMSLSMLGSLFFSAWTHKNKKHRVVQMSQPIFMHLICLGTFIMASAIIPMSIDDSLVSERGCDFACMATPWLFCIGFSITFSALFAKIWRIHTLLSNAMAMRRAVIREKDASKGIILVFALNAVLLLCWTLIDPLTWTRQYTDTTNSYGSCKSNGNASVAFASLLILVNGAALMIACTRAYQARHLDEEFSESRWIGVACASWIQVIVIGVPVLLLTQTQPIAQYFTQTALIFLVCSSMLLLLFVPKMKMISKLSSAPQRSGRTSLSRPDQKTSLYQSNIQSMKERKTSFDNERKLSSLYEPEKDEDIKQLKQRIAELENVNAKLITEKSNASVNIEPTNDIDFVDSAATFQATSRLEHVGSASFKAQDDSTEPCNAVDANSDVV